MEHVVDRARVDCKLSCGECESERKLGVYADREGLVELGCKILKIWRVGGGWDRGVNND